MHGSRESGGKKFFQKSVDNLSGVCYTIYRKREEDTEMEWYLNAENHAEDYEELLALLAEEEGAEG